jgi:hypothetical protein
VHKLLTSGYNFNWTISITPAWAQRKWKNYKHQQIFDEFSDVRTPKATMAIRAITHAASIVCAYLFS